MSVVLLLVFVQQHKVSSLRLWVTRNVYMFRAKKINFLPTARILLYLKIGRTKNLIRWTTKKKRCKRLTNSNKTRKTACIRKLFIIYERTIDQVFQWSSSVVPLSKISLARTRTCFSLRRVISITRWNTAGTVLTPNSILVNRYSPWWGFIAV